MSMDPITAGIDLVTSVISRVWPDKTAQEKAALALALQQDKEFADQFSGQMKVNEAEAANPNLFVAGARPFIMWGLGGILVLYYLAVTVVSLCIAFGVHNVISMPPLDPMIRDIVLGLLGIGWVTRTYEKTKAIK